MNLCTVLNEFLEVSNFDLEQFQENKTKYIISWFQKKKSEKKQTEQIPKALWIYVVHTSSQRQAHYYPEECVFLSFFPFHSSETQVASSQFFHTWPFGNPEHKYRNPNLTVHIVSYFIHSLFFFVSLKFCFDIWPKSTQLQNKLENTFSDVLNNGRSTNVAQDFFLNIRRLYVKFRWNKCYSQSCYCS